VERVLAPTDLGADFLGPALVGGRVAFQNDDRVVLADAQKSLVLELGEPLAVAAGDLAVFRVQRAGEKVMALSLEQRFRYSEPRGDGEFSRLQMNSRGQKIAARSRALSIVRSYFEDEGFLETSTPTFVPSPGLDPHVHSLAEVKRGPRTDHLITSPEFHMKRLLTGGLPRIYQIARCFRAEELGHNHEPEFTLIEWYRAFATWEEICCDTEEIVFRVFSQISGELSYPGGAMLRPFARMTVRDAFQTFAQVDDAVRLAETDEDRYFELLTDRVEPGLAALGRPVFLTHYPLKFAALARPFADDPTVAERFELYVGSAELCNGYGELTDAALQRSRFEAERVRRQKSGEPVYPLDERLLSALSEGMPPSGGNALGFDRLVALATGARTIQETLPFSDDER
jgi:lysyl-tRNA synthetase class 2